MRGQIQSSGERQFAATGVLLPLLGALALTGCATTTHQSEMARPKQTAKVLNKRTSERIKLNYLLFLPEDYSVKSSRRWRHFAAGEIRTIRMPLTSGGERRSNHLPSGLFMARKTRQSLWRNRSEWSRR